MALKSMNNYSKAALIYTVLKLKFLRNFNAPIIP